MEIYMFPSYPCGIMWIEQPKKFVMLILLMKKLIVITGIFQRKYARKLDQERRELQWQQWAVLRY